MSTAQMEAVRGDILEVLVSHWPYVGRSGLISCQKSPQLSVYFDFMHNFSTSIELIGLDSVM
jgi:hypothetical protein